VAKKPIRRSRKRVALKRDSNRLLTNEIDLAFGQASYALVQALFDALLEDSTISAPQVSALFESAKRKLLSLPSYEAAVSLLEVGHSSHEGRRPRFH
jgi:hypothetical protein